MLQHDPAAHDMLVPVLDNWTTLIGFDAREQQYETSLINGGGGVHSDLNLVYPGRGYWLWMNGPGILPAMAI